MWIISIYNGDIVVKNEVPEVKSDLFQRNCYEIAKKIWWWLNAAAWQCTWAGLR